MQICRKQFNSNYLKFIAIIAMTIDHATDLLYPGFPMEAKNAEDVLTKCDNLQIYVITYGLNRESAKGLDVTGFRNDTQINIIDWTSEECLEDEDLMRETVVGLESNSYTSGFSKIRLWYRYSDGDVNSLEK